MPSTREQYLINDKKTIQRFKDLEKRVDSARFRKEAIRITRKAANPLVKVARNTLYESQKKYPRKHRMSEPASGMSKMRYVGRKTTSKPSKSRAYPGVNVIVAKGAIPVGNRSWSLMGYATLLTSGAYKNRKRYTRGKPKKYRGEFAGLGNHITLAAKKQKLQTRVIIRRELSQLMRQITYEIKRR